jgi:hypothetical protein
VKIECRSAGVAAVDRRVDLQEIVLRALIDFAPECGDDPGGHEPPRPNGVADCDYPIPDPGVIPVSPSFRSLLILKREMSVYCRGRSPKDDRHFVSVGDDMVVGYYVASGVDDEPGAERHDFFRGIAGSNGCSKKRLRN